MLYTISFMIMLGMDVQSPLNQNTCKDPVVNPTLVPEPLFVCDKVKEGFHLCFFNLKDCQEKTETKCENATNQSHVWPLYIWERGVWAVLIFGNYNECKMNSNYSPTTTGCQKEDYYTVVDHHAWLRFKKENGLDSTPTIENPKKDRQDVPTQIF